MGDTPAQSPPGSPAHAAGRHAVWLDLGLRDYADASRLQSRLHALRLAGAAPDMALALEHTPCITYGRAAHSAENIVASEELLGQAGIAVYPTDRGGDVTYHGPGQLIVYAIVDLARYGKDVHAHSWRMEQVLIDTLAALGVGAYRRKEYPGVWTDEGKIGAIGLRVSRWVTLHGVSLNVSPHMAHFSLIVPCGIKEHGVTSIAQLLGRRVEMAETKALARASFERVFQVALDDASIGELGV